MATTIRTTIDIDNMADEVAWNMHKRNKLRKKRGREDNLTKQFQARLDACLSMLNAMGIPYRLLLDENDFRFYEGIEFQSFGITRLVSNVATQHLPAETVHVYS